MTITVVFKPAELALFRKYWESLHRLPGKFMPMPNANERQVGGSHYKQPDGGEEHWDRVSRLGLDYFQGQITKYVERCWDKNGLEDLEKARHFLDKYIEESMKKERKSRKQEERIGRCPSYWGTPDRRCVYKEGHQGQCRFEFDEKEVPWAQGLSTPKLRGNWMSRQVGEQAPTGWNGYTFEGTDAGGSRFRCRACREHFQIPANGNPNDHHYCIEGAAAGDATAGYVNQDGPGYAPAGPPATG